MRDEPLVSIIPNSEIVNSFPLDYEQGKNISLTLFYNIITEVLVNVINQEKEMKGQR